MAWLRCQYIFSNVMVEGVLISGLEKWVYFADVLFVLIVERYIYLGIMKSLKPTK